MDTLEAPPGTQRSTLVSLTTLLTNTHHTLGLVIHHQEHKGVAKEAVRSQVMNYISSQDFDADKVYNNVASNYATAFGGGYTPLNTLPLHQRVLIDELIYPEPDILPTVKPHTTPDFVPELPVQIELEGEGDTTGTSDADPDQFHLVETLEIDELEVALSITRDLDGLSSQFYDDGLSFDDDLYDYYDDDDEILLPPLPPRSPPRELDPDKLYGIYDFSGPDPLHLALQRDEAVYLINDQDNYWWLIRKMTKEERFEKKQQQIAEAERNNEFILDLDLVLTLSDDGRIGFVPAECLETYGERLARLNCFKNEEIERYHKNPFDFDLNHPVRQFAMPMDDQDSLSSTSTAILPKKSKNNVTFNAFNQIDIFLEEEPANFVQSAASSQAARDLEAIRAQQKQGMVYDISSSDLSRTSTNFAPLAGDHSLHEDDKHLEVLSDVFPVDQPLAVPKNNNKKKKRGPQRFEEHRDVLPLAKVVRKLGSGSKDKESKLLVLKVALANSGLKHLNLLTKDFKQLLRGTRKIKRFAGPEAELKLFEQEVPVKQLVEFKHLKKKLEKDEYPRFYRPNMLLAAGGSSNRRHLDGSMKRLLIDGTSHARRILVESLEQASTIGSPTAEIKQLVPAEHQLSPKSIDDDVPDANLQQLRRLVILDRLTKMTLDMEEELEIKYGDDSSPAPGAPDFDGRRLRVDKLRKARTQISEIKEEQRRSIDGDVANLSISSDPLMNRSQSKRGSLGGTPRRNSKIDDYHNLYLPHERPMLMPPPTGSPLLIGLGASYGTQSTLTSRLILYSLASPSPRYDDIPARDERRLRAPTKRDLAKKNSQLSVATLTQNDPQLLESGFSEPLDTELSELYMNNSDDDDIDDMRSHGEITPLTLTNLLLLGTPAKSQVQDPIVADSEKRRLRAVHDMFLPVLGKFDELAEKLAEINEML